MAVSMTRDRNGAEGRDAKAARGPQARHVRAAGIAQNTTPISYTTEQEREAIVKWLRTMTASQWNDLPGDPRMPIAFIIADAIERGDHITPESE